ncbi:hypothetical protein CP061683_0056B, partial [Chlamydia psittaci 06-1683]
RGRRFFKNG